MKFYCKQCNLELTRELNELSDKSLLNNEPGFDYIPEGFFIFLNTSSPLVPSSDSDGSLGRDVVINLKDLVNVRPHTDPTRTNGCCGLDGSDGFNTLCVNLHEVGTQSSDCWMAHECTLDAHLVRGRRVQNYWVSAYKLDMGEPLIEFVRGLHLCADEELLRHIESGAVDIDGVVLRDAAKTINQDTIKSGSILRLLDQEARFQLWVDDGLR